jgi:hypothetical protein
MKKYTDYIKENQFNNYITSILKITKGNKAQSDFYEWMLKNTKQIKLTPIDKIPELKGIRDMISPEKKMCYMNASKVVMDFNNKIEYVEGQRYVFGIPVEHAWNKIGDKYFDVTEEIALGGTRMNDEYYSIVELSYTQLLKHLWKAKVYGGLIHKKYEETLKGKK